MKLASINRKSVTIILICLAILFTTAAQAQSVAPRAMRSLGAAVAPGDYVELVRTQPSGENTPFIVPAGYSFVLTDVVVSPQLYPADGWFSWNITSSPELTASVVAQSSAADASSFKLHLNTGMVFRAGNKVRFGLIFAPTSVNVSAFGYLVKE